MTVPEQGSCSLQRSVDSGPASVLAAAQRHLAETIAVPYTPAAGSRSRGQSQGSPDSINKVQRKGEAQEVRPVTDFYIARKEGRQTRKRFAWA